MSGGAIKLAYTIDEGVISISTEEDLAKNVVTRVYDIRDLIINVPTSPTRPTSTSTRRRRRRWWMAAVVAAAATCSVAAAVVAAASEDRQGPARQELVDAIIKLIEDTVSSDSWKDNGGNVGSIRELGGQLIVTQTPENQRSLVRLLEQLRETRAIQVTIETRFLFVQRNFLEDIGVDVDFVFGLQRRGRQHPRTDLGAAERRPSSPARRTWTPRCPATSAASAFTGAALRPA